MYDQISPTSHDVYGVMATISHQSCGINREPPCCFHFLRFYTAHLLPQPFLSPLFLSARTSGAMGKKKSASTSGATKVSRDWGASSISNREVNKLRTLGLISPSDDDIRLPGPASRPKPPKGFTVMFVAFLFRGLSLPAHEFLRSLLFFYGIQLWQLTPNSILHLSIFITVCEAFLGIDPHWGLWRKIFYVKRHNDSNGPPVVGGVGFVVRKEVDYFNYPMKESVQGWRNKWFYLRDTPVSGRRSNLPPFEDVLVAQPKKSWRNALSPEESTIADKLFDQVVDLKNTGGLTMCGTEVVSVFLQRRVQPLMSRPHQLWLYVGKDDKSRVSSADLSNDELRDEVRRLTCLSMKDNIVLTSARPPYDLKHLPAEVIFLFLALITIIVLLFDFSTFDRPPPWLNAILLHPKAVWNRKMMMTTLRRPRMSSISLRTATSRRMKPPRMMLSPGAGGVRG